MKYLLDTNVFLFLITGDVDILHFTQTLLNNNF
jgi:predicted nucleic acid-binding protein